MNHIDWTQAAANRVEQLVNDVKFYMSEGVDKETSLQMAKETTGISDVMWQEVISRA